MKKSNKLIEIKSLLLPIIISIIYSASIIGFSLSMSTIIDNLGKKNFGQAKYYIFFSLKILFLQALFYFFHIKCDNRWVRNRNREIKDKLVSGWNNYKYENFLKEKKLGVNSFILKDLDIIESDYLRSILTFTTNLPLLSLSLISLFQIHNIFILLLLALLITSLLVTIIFSKKIEDSNKLYLEKVKKMNDILNEFVNGFAIMKIFRLSKMVINKLKDRINSQEFERERRANLAQGANGTIMMSTLFIHVIGYALSAWLIYKGELSIGLMIASIEIIGYAFEPIVTITGAFTQMKACNTIISRIKIIIDSEKVEGKAIDKYVERISVNDLSFSYEGTSKPIIENFNMDFVRGNSYAIIGKNGSGKSTLLKILAGLYHSYEGTIKLADKEYRELSEEDLFEKIAYIPQASFLFLASLEENFNSDGDEDIIKYLRAFDIGYIDLHKISEDLSGGELQKLSIIRALIKNTDIVIADEPTSALDDASKAIFFNMIRNDDKLWIVITHDSRELDNFDYVIDLNQ